MLGRIQTFWDILMQNLLLINIVLSIIIIFFQRRDPKSVWTWLLALYFVPIFGFLFYLILAQDFRKSRMFKVKEAEDRISHNARRQEFLIRKNRYRLEDSPAQDFQKLILYNLEAGGSILTLDNRMRIFREGKNKFACLMGEIKRAEKYIHIQYYIIKNDYLFREIVDELRKKVREGIEVRILADGMGARFITRKKWRELTDLGFKIGIFFPPTFGRINLRVNYRNHRKMVIIDGKVGFVGGFNIGKEYLGGDRKFGYWRDTHLMLRGEAVASLEHRFALDWHYATRENLFTNSAYFQVTSPPPLPFPEGAGEHPSPLGIQIITSGPDSPTKLIRDNFIELFHLARRYIYIHTPYFIPDDAVLSALLMAIKSGVEVRLMIPNKPDHPFVYWATLSWAGTLLLEGAKVYIYQKGFLHAKSVMVDGRCACVGTANMDIRSFELNFEVNAVIYDESAVGQLENNFREDLFYCTQLEKEKYLNRGLYLRVKEQLCRLLSPLL